MSNTRKSKPVTFSKGIITDVSEQLQPSGSYRDASNIRITSLDGKHFGVQNINGTSLKVKINNVLGVDKFVFTPKEDFVIGQDYIIADIAAGVNIKVFFGYVDNQNAQITLSSSTDLTVQINSVGDLYSALVDELNSIPNMSDYATFSSTNDGLSYTLNSLSQDAGYVLQKIQVGKLGTAADDDILGNITDTENYTDGEWLQKSSVYPSTANLLIVGHYSFINELFIYTKDEQFGQLNFGHIHKFTFGNNGEVISQQLIYGSEFKFSVNNKLIVRGIVENNCVQRLVWTDNINPLRTINVLDDNLSAQSLESTSATPQYQLSLPAVTNVGVGALPTGMYEYGYKLLSNGGADTSVSSLSNLVPVGLGDFTGDSFDMIGDIAIGEENSGKSLEITIKGLDPNFDKIKVYVIYYANNLAGAGQLYEVVEEDFNGDVFTFIHSELNLQNPSILEEFTVQNNTWRFCKAIEVKDNILFAANLRSLPESFTFDGAIKRFKGISSATSVDPQLELISSNVSSTAATDGEKTNDINFEKEIHRYWKNPVQDSKDGTKYRRILGGHTDNFDTSDSGVRVSFHMTDRIAEENHSIDSPASNTSPSNEINFQQSPNSFEFEFPTGIGAPQGHSNPLWASVFRGYQRGETYRFGIVFYDRMGNPGFVKYIGDIEMPNHEDDYWRINRSLNKTASQLSCYLEADCPDYRLSYVEGFWGPAQVDKVFNTTYTSATDPIDSGYLPKGFAGGDAGVPDYKHRLNDLYVRFEVKLDDATKEAISGFKIVRAKREESDRTVVAQGMLNPMGIFGGNDNIISTVPGTGPATIITEEEMWTNSFANEFTYTGGGSWASALVHSQYDNMPPHSYPSSHSFKLFPINCGVRKNLLSKDTDSNPHGSDHYQTCYAYASGGHTNTAFDNFLTPAFNFNAGSLFSNIDVRTENNEFISFKYSNAANTHAFGWPANSKATHPHIFTFDSLDLMGKASSYQKKANDKLEIISVLSQYSKLRRNHKLSWRNPSPAVYGYEFENSSTPNDLPYSPLPSNIPQFISEAGPEGQYAVGGIEISNALYPQTAQFTNVDILTEVGNSVKQRNHNSVEFYVEDTGLYNKRAYKNQFRHTVNTRSSNQLSNRFTIQDTQELAFGEIDSSFLGFAGNGVVNRGGHDLIISSWALEEVYNLEENNINAGRDYKPGTYDGEAGWFKHFVPINFTNRLNRADSVEGPYPKANHYVTTFDACNPTLGLKIDKSILGINLLSEFYFAGAGQAAGSNVDLPHLVDIDGNNVLDYRTLLTNGISEWRQSSRHLFFFPHRYLCNITREISNQYGGLTEGSIAATRYISTGHFSPVVQDNNFYAADVSGGDTFVNIFAYNKYKGIGMNGETGTNGTQAGSGSVSIPIESKINFDYTHHEHFKRGDYLDGGLESSALDPFITEVDEVEYYDVYSQESTTVGFLSDFTSFDCVVTNFPNQIAYSNTKLSGDTYNAWDTFPPANFHDVDGNLGEINSLFLLKDNLYFLQERGVGNLLVNPRTVITDSSGGQIFTGTGDTVQDHSYISSEFGTIHQHSVCVSDKNAFWADAIHDELFSFDGRNLVSISDVTANKKLIRDIIGGWKYINDNGIQISDYDSLNTLKDFDTPLASKGIHSVYDHKNNEAIFTFFDSYRRNNQTTNVFNTLAYNEQLKLITSKYTYYPSYWISHDNRIFSITNSRTKFYSQKSLAINLWDDELASLCTFEDIASSFSIKVVFNEAPTFAKIFDNLDVIYEAESPGGGTPGNPNPYKFNTIRFTSPETDNIQTVSYTDGLVESYRDGILKLPIRSKSASNRMRGTYITTEIIENVNMTKKYNIFALGYKYRQSNR